MQSIESEAHVDSESAPVDAAHRRPEGVTDADVKALGLLSEALETVEQARGICTPSISSQGAETCNCRTPSSRCVRLDTRPSPIASRPNSLATM